MSKIAQERRERQSGEMRKKVEMGMHAETRSERMVKSWNGRVKGLEKG